jgi:ectoine hydroxylase-related dioxygenase (phytanoyl-CoA dioxygenase family)
MNLAPSEPGPALLTREDVQAYDRAGFVVLRRLLPAQEIAAATAEAERLLDQRRDLIDTKNLRCRWQPNQRTGACEFECFDPIIDLSPACRRLALDARLRGVLARLYDDEPCLFKDKLIYKPPGVKGYGLHQDWIAWPGFPRSFLTVLIPLDAATVANGCTEVFPGYHREASLSPEDGQYHELPPGTVDESHGVPLELEPGDVAIFGGFTPHRSAPNLSDGWRRQLYVSFNKLSDGGDQRTRHYDEFHRWLRQRYAEHGKTDVYFK